MWRIAQEALINVERHADASQVTITWTCDGTTAALAISDNGRGIPDGHKGRIDSYGVLGMRERAASIGASLEMISHPGEGTTVRCCLEQG
jgi:signal transduction histidine kinase